MGDRRDGQIIHRLSLRPTASQRYMHQHLFGPGTRSADVSDDEMLSTLRGLRAAPELDSFRLWLTGSRVEPGRTRSDVDLVISPRAGAVVDGDRIEQALWHCREFGLYRVHPACNIDACFRATGPALAARPLLPDDVITTIKLLSPQLNRMLASGQIGESNPIGKVCLEFMRRAQDVNYYRKLPCADFAGSRWPFLRPAVEIVREADDRAYRPTQETLSL